MSSQIQSSTGGISCGSLPRRWASVVFGLLPLILLGGCKHRADKRFQAPAVGDVTRMDLAVDSHSEVIPGLGAVGPVVELPRSTYQQVINLLDGAVQDETHRKWAGFGSLIITCGTKEHSISFFRSGGGFGIFHADGCYYRIADESGMCQMLEELSNRYADQGWREAASRDLIE